MPINGWMNAMDVIPNPLDVARFRDAIDDNRIKQMKMSEMMKEKQEKGNLEKWLMSTQPDAQSGAYSPQQFQQGMQQGVNPQQIVGMQQEQAKTQQVQQQKMFEDKMKFYGPAMQNFLQSGDNEGLQKLIGQAKADPVLSSRLPQDFSLETSGPGETSITQTYDAPKLQALAKQIGQKNPEIGQAIASSPPGTYKLVTKKHQPAEWTPVEKNESEEVLTRKALHGDKESQSVLDAMEKRKLKIAKEGRAIITNSQGGDQGGLTDDAINLAAEEYLKTNRMPALGLSGKGAMAKARMDIINRAGEIAKSRGQTAEGVVGGRSEFKAYSTTLAENTKRETLTRDFVNRIDSNIKTIHTLQTKYGPQFGRMLNQANNMIQRGIQGSGELESLRLALISTSNEVAKIESGSLGIAGASVEQMKIMEKVHDINLDPKDLNKVLDTSHTLGMNSIESINTENKRLSEKLKGVKGGEQTGQTGMPKPGTVVKGYRYMGGDPSLPASWQKVQ